MRALRLALADLALEPAFSLCTVIALAAVIAPLILLAGMRNGVVVGLRDAIGSTASAREVVNIRNEQLDGAWFDRMAGRPEIAFIVPRTRLLAATGSLDSKADAGRAVDVEVLPTAPGDPWLAALPPLGLDEVAVTAAVAARLGLVAGAELRLRVAIQSASRDELLTLHFRNAGSVPMDQLAIFAPSGIGRQIQEFIDNRACEPACLAEGFRLHARHLDDLPAIVAMLQAEGKETFSKVAEVAGMQRLSQALSAGFALVAGVGGTGFLMGLAATLWASVARKARTLALLHLLGLRRGGLVMIPVWQAIMLALAGALLGAAVASGAATIVNRLPLIGETDGHEIAMIGAQEVGGAMALAVLAAILAAGVPAGRVARMDPADSLRDE
jgi:putative ABC transport system permease protein